LITIFYLATRPSVDVAVEAGSAGKHSDNIIVHDQAEMFDLGGEPNLSHDIGRNLFWLRQDEREK
jgi:hypothetical protein